MEGAAVVSPGPPVEAEPEGALVLAGLEEIDSLLLVVSERLSAGVLENSVRSELLSAS